LINVWKKCCNSNYPDFRRLRLLGFYNTLIRSGSNVFYISKSWIPKKASAYLQFSKKISFQHTLSIGKYRGIYQLEYGIFWILDDVNFFRFTNDIFLHNWSTLRHFYANFLQRFFTPNCFTPYFCFFYTNFFTLYLFKILG